MKDFNELMKGITPVAQYSTGEASFEALTKIIDETTKTATEDYGIIAETQNGLKVFTITYFHPHTFVFNGQDNQGNEAYDILHYSQINLRITKVRKEVGANKRYGFKLDRV